MGEIPYWMHQDPALDVDHRVLFGRVSRPEDALEIERQRNLPREFEIKGEIVTMTLVEWEIARAKKDEREKLQAAAEARGEIVIEEIVLPEPEVRSTPIEVGDPRLPGGAKMVINRATKHGWTALATYSRGPRVHASWGTLLGVSDYVLVRLLLDDGPRRAVASWRDGKFQFAYVLLVNPPHETTRTNSDGLKAWIQGDS